MHCSPGNPSWAKAAIWFAHSDFAFIFCIGSLHANVCIQLHAPRFENHSSGFKEEKDRIIITPSPSPLPGLLSTNFNSSLLILLKPTLERYSLDWCYPMPFLSGFHCAIPSIQGSHCRLLVPMIASDMYSWKDSYSKNDLFFFRLYWVGTDFDSQFQSRIIKL